MIFGKRRKFNNIIDKSNIFSSNYRRRFYPKFNKKIYSNFNKNLYKRRTKNEMDLNSGLMKRKPLKQKKMFYNKTQYNRRKIYRRNIGSEELLKITPLHKTDKGSIIRQPQSIEKDIHFTEIGNKVVSYCIHTCLFNEECINFNVKGFVLPTNIISIPLLDKDGLAIGYAPHPYKQPVPFSWAIYLLKEGEDFSQTSQNLIDPTLVKPISGDNLNDLSTFNNLFESKSLLIAGGISNCYKDINKTIEGKIKQESGKKLRMEMGDQIIFCIRSGNPSSTETNFNNQITNSLLGQNLLEREIENISTFLPKINNNFNLISGTIDISFQSIKKN